MKKCIRWMSGVLLLILLLVIEMWILNDIIENYDFSAGQWTCESWAEYCEQDWR